MIDLLNPALLAGAAAAAAPLIIHVARRRQERRLDWGAMRYLMELLRASRARLQLERWVLLALRTLALLLLALLFTRPSVDAGATGIGRSGPVAAVLLIDDSLSSGHGGASSRLGRALDLARAYVDTLHPGDEVTVLPLSAIDAPPEDPLYDLEAVRTRLKSLRPTAVSSDLPALLSAGLERLQRHLNPAAELVLIADGIDDGWKSTDRARWQELRSRLGGGGPGAADGSRGRPRLVLLQPTATPEDDAWSVTAVTLDRSLVPASVPVDIRIRVQHRGRREPVPMRLQVEIDGRAISELPVVVGDGGSVDLTLRHVFPVAGPALIEAVLVGAGDALPADDRRALALRVEQALPVLVADATGSGDGPGLVVAAALDPQGDGHGLFAVRRIALDALDDAALVGVRAVVITEARSADNATISAVERFCAAGGGVLHSLGDRALPGANAWYRDGDGILPAAVEGPAEGQARPGRPQAGHPAMAPFAGGSADTLRAVEVRRWWRLRPASTQGGGQAAQVLLALDQGDPLIVSRARGLGRSAMLATGLGLEVSGLAAAPAVVPLLRGLVADLGSILLPARNLRPGDRLVYAPPLRAPGAAATASGPHGPVALEPTVWEGRSALRSPALPEIGAYRVQDGDASVLYAVAADAGESALDPLPDAVVVGCLGGLPVVRATDERDVRSAFAGADRGGVELWRWLALAALLVLAAEGLWSRRTVLGERRLAGNRA